MIPGVIELAPLAALPSLPIGKGATILILGGLYMLFISMVWTLLSLGHEATKNRKQRLRAPAGTAARGSFRPARGPGVAMASRSAPARKSDRTPQRAERDDSSALKATTLDEAWLERELTRFTTRLGYGRTELLASWPDLYRLRLTKCGSCHDGDPNHGCENERRALRDAVAPYVDRPQVTEVACHNTRPAPCVFEVRAGGR